MARTASSEKVIHKLPASEDGYGVLCKTKSGSEYVISQNLDKGKFTLWSFQDGQYLKISTADSPIKLYEQINWQQ